MMRHPRGKMQLKRSLFGAFHASGFRFGSSDFGPPAFCFCWAPMEPDRTAGFLILESLA
jgi:hypothetical protein